MKQPMSGEDPRSEASRIQLGRHERHVHYLLPHEEGLVDQQLAVFTAQQTELAEMVQEAVEQSSETTHDNAPRDVVIDAQGTLYAVAKHTLRIKREKEIVDYPDDDNPLITLGSRVELTLNGEPLFVDVLGFKPIEEDDEAVPVTYTAPLAAVLLGHEAGQTFHADINGDVKTIGIIAVDQFTIRNQFAVTEVPHEG